MDYRHGSHTKFSLPIHVVWMTKYRNKVLKGELANFIRDMLREECSPRKVDILKGPVSKDHIHRLLSIPPQLTISRLVQPRKGKSSFKALSHFSELKKGFWGRHLWARGYLVHPSGNVTGEVIKMYLENQKHDDDNFQIEQ